MVGASTSKGEDMPAMQQAHPCNWSLKRNRRFVLAEHRHHVEKTRGCRPPGERRPKRLRHLAELGPDRLRMLAHDRLHALRRPVGNGVELCDRCRRGARGRPREGSPPSRPDAAGAGHRGNRRCREARRGSWRAPSGPAWRRGASARRAGLKVRPRWRSSLSEFRQQVLRCAAPDPRRRTGACSGR